MLAAIFSIYTLARVTESLCKQETTYDQLKDLMSILNVKHNNQKPHYYKGFKVIF